MTNKTINELEIELQENYSKMRQQVQIYLNNKILDINQYADIYINMSNDWLYNYICHRIDGKKKEGVNPNLTENDIITLKNNTEFCNYFKYFMEKKLECDFYIPIENDIINITRSEPTSDNNLGKPMIDYKIREKNSNFVSNLSKETDGCYILIEEYLNHIERTHDNMLFLHFITLQLD